MKIVTLELTWISYAGDPRATVYGFPLPLGKRLASALCALGK